MVVVIVGYKKENKTIPTCISWDYAATILMQYGRSITEAPMGISPIPSLAQAVTLELPIIR